MLFPNGRFPVPKRIAGRMVWTQRRLLTSEPPESHVVRWIQKSLSKGGKFFDVGAHYGWISIAAASRVGASGRVIAFEASPVLIDILSFHKKINRLAQIEIVPRAVSNVNDAVVPFFLVNEGLSSRNSMTIESDDMPFIAPGEKTRCEVPSVSLDHFVDSSGIVPTLIKIDVEGAELLVLQGAERLITRFRPTLVISIHPYWLPRSQNATQFVEFLTHVDYEISDEFVVNFEGGYLADYLCSPIGNGKNRRQR